MKTKIFLSILILALLTIGAGATTTRNFEIKDSCVQEPPIFLWVEVDCDVVTLYWEFWPEDLLGYNVYRNGVLIAFVVEPTIMFENLPPGTYEYFVTAVYEMGESEPSNIVTVIIDNNVPPENFVAVVQGTDVLCAWDSVESKYFVGYRVYRNDEDISDLINETEYIDVNTSMGTYVYYAKAEYNNCLSDPSDSVTIVITGIEDNFVNQIQLYPNPVKDFVIIKSDYFIKSIRVFNHTGRKVADEIAENKLYQFNTSKLKSGLYLFEIETGEGITTKRIIVE